MLDELVRIRVVDVVPSLASQINLLRTLQESLARLIGHCVVQVGLLHVEYFGEHGHIELLVHWHVLIEYLCGFFR